jgi:cytochrome b561
LSKPVPSAAITPTGTIGSVCYHAAFVLPGRVDMLRNSETSWGTVAKALHWVIAVVLLISMFYGWWMTRFSVREFRLDHYGLHGSIGYDLLLLMLLRLGWRTFDSTPLPPPGTAHWEVVAAKVGHVLLYLLTIVVCIAGWLLAGTMRRPLDAPLLGFIDIPVPPLGRSYHELFEDSHKIIAYTLLALIVVHVAAALRHHFIKRNDVLRRML